MKSKMHYGWKPDIPDQRDYIYKRKLRLFTPSEIDLRGYCSKVETQGKLGSCTAQALAGNIEFLSLLNGNTYSEASRLFIYYNERRIEGTIGVDSGAYLRDGIKSLVKWGVCNEDLWAYDIKKFNVTPPDECYIQAGKNKITSYQRLAGVSDMISCLVEGYPIVFGIAVYESFESELVKDTGVVDLPNENEILLGGHAILAVGYSMPMKRFIVKNSWGEDWGQKGYFTLPFKYVEKLGDDFWTIRK